MYINGKLNYASFVVSVSYGNYVGTQGGTNKVILAHKEILGSAGISHVHIFPCLIRIPLTNVFPFRYWGMTVDGHTLKNVFTISEIIQVLGRIINSGSDLLEMHIHHMMFLNVTEFIRLVDMFFVPIKFYLHDFYSICVQVNLLKNDTQYCGEGVISEKKCGNCKYYIKSSIEIPYIVSFLDRYKGHVQVIAPSEVAKEIWSSAYPDYKDQVFVVWHQFHVGLYKDNCEIIPQKAPLKIAFVGGKAFNKGWSSWINVTKKACDLGCNEDFFHFGNPSNTPCFIKGVPVRFSSKNINAMVAALRTYQIDVAVLWSIWPETYSYTYYESSAANTFIITNKNSGNIAAMVKERNNGVVLENESEFSELICDEKKLRSIVNQFKQSKNYGPLDLVDNSEFLQLMSKGGDNIKTILPKYTDNVLYSAKRRMVSIIYNIHQRLKKAKNA